LIDDDKMVSRWSQDDKTTGTAVVDGQSGDDDRWTMKRLAAEFLYMITCYLYLDMYSIE